MRDLYVVISTTIVTISILTEDDTIVFSLFENGSICEFCVMWLDGMHTSVFRISCIRNMNVFEKR